MNLIKQIKGVIKKGNTYHFKGDLSLKGTDFTTFSHNLVVTGDLDLSECTKLKSITGNLKVEGCLDLSGCKNLESITGNLKIGSLYATGCKSLKKLPDDIKNCGTIDLEGCKNLKSLPSNLKEVCGDLTLDGCSKLKSLPENMEVMGYIAYNGKFIHYPYKETPFKKERVELEGIYFNSKTNRIIVIEEDYDFEDGDFYTIQYGEDEDKDVIFAGLRISNVQYNLNSEFKDKGLPDRFKDFIKIGNI